MKDPKCRIDILDNDIQPVPQQSLRRKINQDNFCLQSNTGGAKFIFLPKENKWELWVSAVIFQTLMTCEEKYGVPTLESKKSRRLVLFHYYELQNNSEQTPVRNYTLQSTMTGTQ